MPPDSCYYISITEGRPESRPYFYNFSKYRKRLSRSPGYTEGGNGISACVHIG